MNVIVIVRVVLTALFNETAQWSVENQIEGAVLAPRGETVHNGSHSSLYSAFTILHLEVLNRDRSSEP